MIKTLTQKYDNGEVLIGAGTILPQAPMVPTGGVTPQNVHEWLQAGCVAFGVGSYITKAPKKDGDYGKVTAAAKEFLQAVAISKQS